MSSVPAVRAEVDDKHVCVSSHSFSPSSLFSSFSFSVSENTSSILSSSFLTADYSMFYCPYFTNGLSRKNSIAGYK